MGFTKDVGCYPQLETEIIVMDTTSRWKLKRWWSLVFFRNTFLGRRSHNLTNRDRGKSIMPTTRNHTLINRCLPVIDNPQKYQAMRESLGLTPGISERIWFAHLGLRRPGGHTADCGCLSSRMPYTPSFSMQALRYFYEGKGENWTKYGLPWTNSANSRLLCEVASGH